MAPFQFRLATLLQLREADRRQRRLELAEALRAEELLQRQARELTIEIRDLEERSRVASAPGRVSVDQLLDVHRYKLLLLARVRLLDQKAEQLRREVERRRQVLVEANRQARVLEKLRERDQQEHEAAELKQERKELDETAVQLWGRNTIRPEIQHSESRLS